MKTRFLFPRKFRIAGILLLLFGLVFFYIDWHFSLQIFVWHNFRPSIWWQWADRDECFDDEIQLAAMMLGLMLFAFSKEKIEDEQIAYLRLQSLQWAVYINYAVFFMIIFTVYGVNFLAATVYNVLTLLIFFILRFRWGIYQNNKLMKETGV